MYYKEEEEEDYNTSEMSVQVLHVKKKTEKYELNIE